MVKLAHMYRSTVVVEGGGSWLNAEADRSSNLFGFAQANGQSTPSVLYYLIPTKEKLSHCFVGKFGKDKG